MISSAESSFCKCNDSGNQLVWRSKNTRYVEKNTISTEKFGGGRIMVWGYISFYGRGELVFLEGNVNQNTYKTLLEENLIPFIQRNADKSFSFIIL